MNKSKIVLIVFFCLVFLSSLMSKKRVNEEAYHISPVKCVGCQACVVACPVQAISIQGGKAVIDQTKCIECDICVGGDFADYAGCPTQAINRPLEEKEVQQD